MEAERQKQIPNLIHYPSGGELGYFCDVEENILIPGVVNDLLTKSLNTANVTKLSTVDKWGNVEIPGLGFLINTTHDVDNRAPAPNPWVAVAPGDKNIDYSRHASGQPTCTANWLRQPLLTRGAIMDNYAPCYYG